MTSLLKGRAKSSVGGHWVDSFMGVTPVARAPVGVKVNGGMKKSTLKVLKAFLITATPFVL